MYRDRSAVTRDGFTVRQIMIYKIIFSVSTAEISLSANILRLHVAAGSLP